MQKKTKQTNTYTNTHTHKEHAAKEKGRKEVSSTSLWTRERVFQYAVGA